MISTVTPSPAHPPMEIAQPAANARSLTRQAFEQLRSDILHGHLRPTERLRITALAERYEVGATAIREALSRLVADGLVEAEEQRGFCVAPVSREELIDLTQTRIDVETLALRNAVARGDVEWESGLLSAFHRLSKAQLPTTPEHRVLWAATHRQFHEALLAGCGSPWLLRLCGLLYDKSERYRNLAEQAPQPPGRDTVSEHRALMDAAMQRDADGASRLLALHFNETMNIILRAGFGGARPAPQETKK